MINKCLLSISTEEYETALKSENEYENRKYLAARVFMLFEADRLCNKVINGTLE